MPNSSATGGYLLPTDTLQTDAALDAIVQQFAVGTTGIPGTLVRPRWTPEAAAAPEATIDWMAIGIMDIVPDDNAAVQHGPSGDLLARHEEIIVLASFYGPNGQKYGLRMRDALWVEQNREVLSSLGIGFVGVSSLGSVPEILNNQWRRRYDLTVTFRRVVTRAYNVLDLASSAGHIGSDDGPAVDFSVNP